MKSSVIYIQDLLGQDELMSDFSFNQILRRLEDELKLVSYGKRSKKSGKKGNQFFYFAAV